jgi:hypothetical protein
VTAAEENENGWGEFVSVVKILFLGRGEVTCDRFCQRKALRERITANIVGNLGRS